jgi:hypothetical protein
MPDRYVVEPAFGPGWSRAAHGGNSFDHVAEAFRYGSDTNPEFLSVEEIRALLAVASTKSGADINLQPTVH